MSAEIARTIADQLTQSNNGYNRLKAMIAGNNFYYSSANDKNLGGDYPSSSRDREKPACVALC